MGTGVFVGAGVGMGNFITPGDVEGMEVFVGSDMGLDETPPHAAVIRMSKSTRGMIARRTKGSFPVFGLFLHRVLD